MGKRRLLLGVLLMGVFCLLAGFSQAAEFACEWRTSSSCLSNQTLLIRANSSEATPPDNSHVQLANFSGDLYNVSLCCWTDVFRRLNNTCDGTDVIGVADNTSGSHVQIGSNTTYAWRACYNVTSGNVECEYPRDSCTAGYAQMFSMSSSEVLDNETDAHIGNFATYTKKVCCGIGGQTPPTLDLLNLTPRNHTITRNGLWCQAINPADADGDSVTVHYNWILNGTSVAVVNLPMDFDSANEITHDISGYENHGNVNGNTVFQPTDGRIGGSFNFSNGNISIPNDDSFEIRGNVSIAFWMNMQLSGPSAGLVEVSPNYQFSLRYTNNNLIWNHGNSSSNQQISFGAILSNNTWQHIVVTRDNITRNLTAYSNGVSVATTTYSAVLRGINASTSLPLLVGDGTSAALAKGSLDEVIIFNRTLTPNEVLTLYNLNNEYFNQSEVSRGDLWNCSAVPVDSTGLNGTTYYSNSTYFRGSPPLNVTLLSPYDGNLSAFYRYMPFNWTDTDEPDGDTLNYIFNLTVEAGACSIETAQTNIQDSNYTSPVQLCIDQNYKWNVTVCDIDGCSPVSDTFNFTIASVVSFNLTNDSINFGVRSIGNTNYTDDHNPYPFQLNNDGNVLINMTLVGNDSLFTSVGLDDAAYQYRIEENETNSLDAASQLTYTPVPSTAEWAIVDLNFTDSRDEAMVHLNITVPTEESPGVLTSNITLRAVISE